MKTKKTKKMSAFSLKTISGKYRLLATVSVIWLGLFAALVMISHSVSDKANGMMTGLNEIQTDIFELRAFGKDFLLRPDKSWQGRFATTLAELKNDLILLKSDTSFLASITKLEEKLKQIEETFNELFTLQEKIGFNEQEGLLGQVVKSAREIEEAVKKFDNQRLLIDLLQLRRVEKNFIMRKESRYADQFKSDWAVMENLLTGAALSAELKASLLEQIKAYRDRFLAVISATEAFGFNDEQGLQKKFKDEMIGMTTEINELYAQIFSSTDTILNKIFLANMFSLLIWALIIFINLRLISHSLLKPLKKISSFFSRLANELAENRVDLSATVSYQKQDEIGGMVSALNQFVASLQESFLAIEVAARKVKTISQQIATNSSTLASSSQEQSASITETSATLEEMVATFRSGGKNITEISSDLDRFYGDVNKKTDHMGNVTQTMQAISDSSAKINTIINVINVISFQTNLLALNAAVEAARAGEAGRGFAVVAAEVRNLAQKAAESSKSIQEIVSQNVDATQTGLNLTQETASFFQDIIARIQHFLLQLKENTQGINEQTVAIEQLNIALAQLSDTVNNNTDVSSELARTAAEMNLNADELLDVVAKFSASSQVQGTSAGPEKKKSIVAGPPAKKAERKSANPTPKSKNKTETAAPKPLAKKPDTAKDEKKPAPVEHNANKGSKESAKKSAETHDDFFDGFSGEGFEEF